MGATGCSNPWTDCSERLLEQRRLQPSLCLGLHVMQFHGSIPLTTMSSSRELFCGNIAEPGRLIFETNAGLWPLAIQRQHCVKFRALEALDVLLYSTGAELSETCNTFPALEVHKISPPEPLAIARSRRWDISRHDDDSGSLFPKHSLFTSLRRKPHNRWLSKPHAYAWDWPFSDIITMTVMPAVRFGARRPSGSRQDSSKRTTRKPSNKRQTPSSQTNT